MNLHLKKINFFFSNKLINFEKLFNKQIWFYENLDDEKNRIETIISLIRFSLGALKRSIFTSPLIIFPKIKKRSIIYIKAYSRTDIDAHSKYYLNGSDITLCLFRKRQKKIDLTTFFVCIFFLIKFRKLWLKTLRKNKVNFISVSGIKIFFEFFSALSDLIKIYPILIKHSKLISFQEMVIVENLICQIANLLNIKTFALQHGMHSKKDNKNHFLKGLSVNDYLSSVCKNILCWGKYNKKIYEKFTNAKIFIIGKASLPVEKQLKDGVTIIFESKACKKDNEKLFTIYNKLITHGIPVSRWFKPGHNLIKNIYGHEGPLRKIIIGINSTLLFELGYLGYKVYVTKDSNVYRDIPSKLIINNSNLISKITFNPKNYPHNIWKYFIECSEKKSVQRFKKIINQ